MSKSKTLILSFLLCFSPVVSAYAETAAEEITRITESIAVLNAKKTELEVKAQIAAKQAEIDKHGGTSTFDEPKKYESMPVIRGIEGVDGKLFAVLSYGRGIEQTVKLGDRTRGNWKVAAIDVRSVSLSRGKEKVQLIFGQEPPTSNDSVMPSGMPGAMPFMGPQTVGR